MSVERITLEDYEVGIADRNGRYSWEKGDIRMIYSITPNKRVYVYVQMAINKDFHFHTYLKVTEDKAYYLKVLGHCKTSGEWIPERDREGGAKSP